LGGRSSVPKEIQQAINQTVITTLDKINNISAIDILKAKRDLCYTNTERLLYNYLTLKEHVSDEEEYMEMINKGKSSSVVIFNSNRSNSPNYDDEALKQREASLERSRRDLDIIERALNKVKSRREYQVLEYKYFKKKEDGDSYTIEEIAEILDKSDRTIRRWRSSIVKDISIYIFGSDAIA